MNNHRGYWFRSTLFSVEPGEDENTNPRCYGKQPAHWLRTQLEKCGYSVVEAIPEDWGWCVMCQRDPFLLWVGCRNRSDYDTAKPEDPPPRQEDLLWHCL